MTSTSGICGNSKEKKPALRIMTYMCPSIPVEYFELLAHYLEYKMEVDTFLLYETRYTGPIAAKKLDPFAAGHVDIAFMTTSSYMQLMEKKSSHIELLPVSSVHRHPKHKDIVPGYYSDVIVPCEARNRVKTLLDLRGTRFGFCEPQSFSGHFAALQALKQNGESGTFFSSISETGSHQKSIERVLDGSLDVAAVDSNALMWYLKKHEYAREKIFTLQSIGPLAPYPIVVRSKLPSKVKLKLTDALLNFHKESSWKEQMGNFGLMGFAQTCTDSYNKAQQMKAYIGAMTFDAIYY